MSTIQNTRYVLAVKNLNISTQYYVNKLGFSILNEYPGWCFLGRESFIIMLGECKDTDSANDIGDHSYFAYVDVSNVSDLNKELKVSDVVFIKELTSEPWGMKEFGIKTVDGHRIMFGEDINN